MLQEERLVVGEGVLLSKYSQILSLKAGWQWANWFDSNAPNASTSDWSMTKSCLPSLRGDLYRCAPSALVGTWSSRSVDCPKEPESP